MEHTDPNFETWESSTDEAGKAGLITVYAGGSGSATFTNDEPHGVAPQPLVDTILGHIDDVVRGTADTFNGKAWLDYWTGDPWTLGSYAAFTPGQMTKYWGYNAIPVDRVHFAGEHTSTYSQGFLNGGVESGQRAAIEVMRAIGAHVPKDIASMPYSQVPA
jgi:monoamine oxidase